MQDLSGWLVMLMSATELAFCTLLPVLQISTGWCNPDANRMPEHLVLQNPLGRTQRKCSEKKKNPGCSPAKHCMFHCIMTGRFLTV